jgi:hypothetical protein
MGGVSPHREHTQRLVAKSVCNLHKDLGEANPFTLLVSDRSEERATHFAMVVG